MHNPVFNSTVLAACGALCMTGAFALVIYGTITKRWHAVKANVAKRELNAITVDDRSLKYELRRRESVYIKNIFYDYFIDGRSFRGRSIYVFGFRPFGGSRTTRFLEEHGGCQEGSEIQIYVDLRHPKRAVMMNGVPVEMVSAFLLIGAVSLGFLALPTVFFAEHIEASLYGLLIGFAVGCGMFTLLFIRSVSMVIGAKS